MGQLRELDLQLAFKRAGTLGKDIQNQPRSIDHPGFKKSSRLRSWLDLNDGSPTQPRPDVLLKNPDLFCFA